MTFESLKAAWERIPVDGQGYHSSRMLLAVPDEELRSLIEAVEAVRYDESQDRNHDGLWRLGMALDVNHGRVLDYGCGIGVEALQYARSGNTVSVADINASTVRLAARVLRLYGFNPARMMKIPGGPGIPLTEAGNAEYDLVAMNGVLHHIPDPVPTVEEAYRLLIPGGELRLMVYSDEGWRIMTGTEPPENVAGHPALETFVMKMDFPGVWCDWYDCERLKQRFGDLFDVRETRYITHDRRFLTATLVKR